MSAEKAPRAGGNIGAHLKSFVERVERLEEEKKSFADDIKDVYAEAKSTGFDVKVLRAIVRLRKQSKAERQEFEAVLDEYDARAYDV